MVHFICVHWYENQTAMTLNACKSENCAALIKLRLQETYQVLKWA